MAYTRPWDDSKPLGSELAKNIDDIIRDLKADIHERMDEGVVDWTADPVVFKGGSTIGGPSGTGIVVPFTSFIAHAPAFYPVYQNDSVLCNGSGVYNASVIIPAGLKIKKVNWIVDRGDANVSINCALVMISFDTLSVPTVISTITQSTAGKSLISSADLDQAVGTNEMFYLQVTCVGINTFRIYGASVLTA